jgi:hypothetical protein
MEGHYFNEKSICEDCDSGYESNEDSIINNYSDNNININKHNDINSKKIKSLKDYISKLPFEIKYHIYSYIPLFKQKYNRKLILDKSNQPNFKFKKHDETKVMGYEVNWQKFNIGDCVIHRGNTKNAFREKKLYIRSWCINCRYPNNQQLGNGEDYFKYIYNYKCKSCRDLERYSIGGVLAYTGYRVCRGCLDKYEDRNYEKPEYCDNCFVVNIKQVFNTIIYNCKINNRKILIFDSDTKLICYPKKIKI